MKNTDCILIADCHIRSHSDRESDFFAMLEQIEKNPPGSVIFLGDIFELWIALDGYESFGHLHFIDWCRRNRTRFEIGFIEGNHEFYIREKYQDAFSWISNRGYCKTENLHFIHGDLINRADRNYLLLRCLIRNPFTRFLLKLFACSIGPHCSDLVRRKLKNTNLEYKRQLPVRAIEEYSCQPDLFAGSLIFAGHFHEWHRFQYDNGSVTMILPAWENKSEIVVYHQDKTVSVAPWKDLYPTA